MASNILSGLSVPLHYYWMRSWWPQPHYLEPDPISLTGYAQMCHESPCQLSMWHIADPICYHPVYQSKTHNEQVPKHLKRKQI